MKKLIKKWFNLFDKQDFENALANVGDCKDRYDLETKLRFKLFGKWHA